MNIEQLIVYNSTIPAGQGTVLDHLMNIKVNREAIDIINTDTSLVSVSGNVVDAAISGSVKSDKLVVSITDTVVTTNVNNTLGVDI